MHFLVIDRRFGVPIYVFLEKEASTDDGGPVMKGRWVTLESVLPPDHGVGQHAHGGASVGAIGSDPEQPDRFAEFASDGHVRAAGFTLIEPRYVGPSWETYLSVFRPEGGKRGKPPLTRLPGERVARVCKQTVRSE
jgi:hypothetical protein